VTIAVTSETLDRESDQVDDPLPSVTITVQITVPNGVLPRTARRLVDDLRNLTRVVDLSAIELDQATSLCGRVRPELLGVGARSGAQVRAGSASQTTVPTPRRGADALPQGLRTGRSGLDGQLPLLYLETGSRTVWCDGTAVHLSRREYDLLNYLCRNPRRVFSRAQLLRNVWGYEMVGGERTVDVHVRRLRAKLDRCADGIVTVRGIGYRFDDEAAVAVVIDAG
jgi:two-component system, OmpR family, response regulator